jgi:hypothetical protein
MLHVSVSLVINRSNYRYGNTYRLLAHTVKSNKEATRVYHTMAAKRIS